MDQDISGILQNEADVLTRYIRDRVISEYIRSATLSFKYIVYYMPMYLWYR